MKRILFFIIWICVHSAGSPGISFAAKGSIEYRVSMPEPHTHYFEVEIQLRNYEGSYVDFKMPVWTPGSYLVREYAKNVEGFRSMSSEGHESLNFHKVDKSTWRVDLNETDNVIVRYRVYAFEGNIRMSYLDENHAFIMANTLLMYVKDIMASSSVLRLTYPNHWNSVSTSLSKVMDSEFTYYVPNYHILVDSPIEIGNHEIINFVASGVPHEVALVGKVEYNKDQLVRDLTKIIESATSIFEENPNEKYIFIVQANDKRGGGLEHMSSTALGIDRWSLSNQASYNKFLSLVAHEYFHLWMVKRLKPIELEELDYDREVYTDLLWVMEGFTSYFEEKIMLDCNFYTEQKFISNLLSAMASIRNTPGSNEQSVAESSFDAWIKYYRKNENSLNNQISYYNKGMVLGALLDLQIIAASNGAHSLNDVVNQLYYQFYKRKKNGITSDDLMKVSEKFAGTNLSDFFSDYVYGTIDLENEKFLHFAGIGLIETNSSLNSASMGISVKRNSLGLEIGSINKNGSAFENGLNVGDELISINGYRVNASNYKTILNHFKVGDNVSVLLSRDGIIVEKKLDLRKDSSVSYMYELLDNTTKHQEMVYGVWLGK